MLSTKTARAIMVSVLMILICSTIIYGQMGPTVTQTGIFESVSPSHLVSATINDKIEQVCLPRIDFQTDVDSNTLRRQLQEGIARQEAVFHLYHDGLARPKRQGGMLYASDVYLREQKITYTGFLRQLGYKIKISKTPPHEDTDHMRSILYGTHLAAEAEQKQKKEEKAAATAAPAAADESEKPSSRRIKTIYDVLPEGVIPPSIRSQLQEVNKRIKELKERPYEEETVLLDPVRWTTGRMGIMREDGTISGAFVEGQKPEMFISVPSTPNWLTAEMMGQINGQICEFVFQRDTNGLEVQENGRYYVRDLYFRNLRLTWKEWLEKHGQRLAEPVSKPNYATTNISLRINAVKGSWEGFKAPVLCVVNLNSKTELVRMLPPQQRPSNFAAFARLFDQKFKGKPINVSLLVCPNGQPYVELGQRRARRIYFTDEQDTLSGLQHKVITGRIR